MKNLILMVFLNLLCNNYLQSQTAAEYNINNNLAYNNNVSQEHYGAYNTILPLGEHVGREFNLPISLSYSSTGIKVNQVAGIVGLGWSLNLGGKIESIINNKPDHLISQTSCNSYQSEPNELGSISLGRDFYSANAIGMSNVFQFIPCYGGISDFDNAEVAIECNQPRSLTDKNYSIITSPYMGLPNEREWIIMDGTGNKFYFGQFNLSEKINSKTYLSHNSNNPNCFNTQEYITSWLLTKIESKNALDCYSFIYDNYEWTNFLPHAIEGSTRDIHNSDYLKNLTEYKLSQKMLKEVFHNGEKILSLVYGSRNDISFVGGTNVGNALKSINFYNFKSQNIYKKIVFNHSYFGNVNTNTPEKDQRLMLTDFFINGVDNNGISVNGEQYKFEYFDPENLPAINSNAQDYIGFYNAKNANTSLIPISDSRKFNLNASLTGNLKKITYPKKSYTEFEFEQHHRFGGFGKVFRPSSPSGAVQEVNLANFQSENYWCPAQQQYTGVNSDMSPIDCNNFINSPYTNFNNLRQINSSKISLIDLSNEINNTVCNIQTSGDGIYAIVKLNSCGQSDIMHLDECNDETILMDGCFIDMRDVVANGLSNSHTFKASGLTAANSINSVNLEPGKYQVILWRFNVFGTSTVYNQLPSIRVFKNITVYNPSYFEDLDVVSVPFDGFRIKKIKNFNYDGSIVNQKLFRYGIGGIEPLENFFTVHDYALSHHYNAYTSRCYNNAPNIVKYDTIYEIILDKNNEFNGYKSIEYSSQGNYPIHFSGTASSFLTPYCGTENKPKITNRILYNNDYKKVKSYHYAYFNNGSSTIFGSIELGISFPIPADSLFGDILRKLTIYDFIIPDDLNSVLKSNITYDYKSGFNHKSYYQSKTTSANETVEAFKDEQFLNGINAKTKLLSDVFSSKTGTTLYSYSEKIGQFLNLPKTRYLLTEIQNQPVNGTTPEPKTRYDYDQDGNMIEMVNVTPGVIPNNQYESYIYGYNNRFVVAKITGARYSDIPTANITAIKNASNQIINDANNTAMETALNALRNVTALANAQITTTTINPVFGPTSVTDPKGYTIYSEYNVFGRLALTKEKNPLGGFNILSETKYNTRPN